MTRARPVAPKKPQSCCYIFQNATEPGTDRESYGSLVEELGGEWYLTSELPPIKFCPWCGGQPGVQA